ncbi:hypothetical protein [Thermogemmata fonticola]|uniref:Uncharacterized protein n=1 Tax=Thermogemmata fonticola TaxID=2755323 RepID=A0A7V8VGZ5_9BACT|nr:hypothetical protein [Thermogemmata fonticola]MBA2227747.1 hypothetical protein [Thermogemmata fonticola]
MLWMRWKLLAGGLAVSLGGLAALAGPCTRTDNSKGSAPGSAASAPAPRPLESAQHAEAKGTVSSSEATAPPALAASESVPLPPVGGPARAPASSGPAPDGPPPPASIPAAPGSIPPASASNSAAGPEGEAISVPAPPAIAMPIPAPPAGLTPVPAPSASVASPTQAVQPVLPEVPPPAAVGSSASSSGVSSHGERTGPATPMTPPAPPALPEAAPSPAAVPPAAVQPAVPVPSAPPAVEKPVVHREAAALPQLAQVSQRFRVLLRVGEGEPAFEVRCGDDLMLKVVCERVDVKSAAEPGEGLASVKAMGRVRFVGFGAEGTCEELSFLAGDGSVQLQGRVVVRVKDKLGRVESELSGESLRYRIDPAAMGGVLRP